MTGYYLELRHVHIGCALVSVALFVLRGGLSFGGVDWRRSVVFRYLPHVVDTVLLTTALMLASIVQQYPFVHGWLTTKVALLVAYVVLGSLALREGRSRRTRLAAFAAALAAVGFLLTVARAHHPLGLFAALAP